MRGWFFDDMRSRHCQNQRLAVFLAVLQGVLRYIRALAAPKIFKMLVHSNLH